MKDATLGSFINETAQRDAVHVAIAPVVAAHAMNPGQHVGLLDNGTVSAKAEKLIGIVDPFLKEVVVTGERFWLCLYQGTVTGMKHHWSHPSFADNAESVASEKAASEQWLNEFCKRIGYASDRLIDDAKCADGDGICLSNDTPSELYEDTTKELVLMHLSRVTGKTFSSNTHFRCAC